MNVHFIPPLPVPCPWPCIVSFFVLLYIIFDVLLLICFLNCVLSCSFRCSLHTLSEIPNFYCFHVFVLFYHNTPWRHLDRYTAVLSWVCDFLWLVHLELMFQLRSWIFFPLLRYLQVICFLLPFAYPSSAKRILVLYCFLTRMCLLFVTYIF